MRYCHICAIKNKWPYGIPAKQKYGETTEFGKCDVCGETGICNVICDEEFEKLTNPGTKAPKYINVKISNELYDKLMLGFSPKGKKNPGLVFKVMFLILKYIKEGKKEINIK